MDDLGYIMIEKEIFCSFFPKSDGLNTTSGSEMINAFFKSSLFFLWISNGIKGLSWFLIYITFDLKKKAILFSSLLNFFGEKNKLSTNSSIHFFFLSLIERLFSS